MTRADILWQQQLALGSSYLNTFTPSQYVRNGKHNTDLFSPFPSSHIHPFITHTHIYILSLSLTLSLSLNQLPPTQMNSTPHSRQGETGKKGKTSATQLWGPTFFLSVSSSDNQYRSQRRRMVKRRTCQGEDKGCRGQYTHGNMGALYDEQQNRSTKDRMGWVWWEETKTEVHPWSKDGQECRREEIKIFFFFSSTKERWKPVPVSFFFPGTMDRQSDWPTWQTGWQVDMALNNRIFMQDASTTQPSFPPCHPCHPYHPVGWYFFVFLFLRLCMDG